MQRLIRPIFFSIAMLFSLLNGCQPMATTVPAATPGISVPTAKSTPSIELETTALRPTEGSPLATVIPTFVPTPTLGATASQKEEIAQTMISTSSAPLTVGARECVTITIVYDNNSYDPRLRAAWGFAALVEYRDQTLLFDTGGDGTTLLNNMAVLGIDPLSIEDVVLSHAHGDHTGGLSALLAMGTRPTVYLPPSFSASFKQRVSQTTAVVDAMPGQFIADGIFTTGEMGQGLPEQALVIKTDRGLVVLTGCAHPGVTRMTAQAKALFGEPVHLVLGGFHLGSKSAAEISSILAEFRRLGVETVAPCHCTGERAISRLAAEYGENFIQAGVGRVITIGP